ncbi:hypothetical protein ACLKA7_000909, partial [Drosophila subpalustris]
EAALAKAKAPRPVAVQDRAPAHKRTSSTLAPLTTQKPVATPARAAQKVATVVEQQEAQDERPSTSPAAAASHGDLSAIEEALLDEVILTEWDTAVSFTGIHFHVGHLSDYDD